MTFKAEIKGVKAMNKMVEELPGMFPHKVNVGSLKASGRVLAREAKQRVPVKTGDLKSSITSIESDASRRAAKKGSKGKSVVGMGAEVFVGFKKPHSRRAHLVEFGFVHRSGVLVKAQPFMRPAVDDSKRAMFTAFAVKQARDLKKISQRISRQFNKISASDRRIISS